MPAPWLPRTAIPVAILLTVTFFMAPAGGLAQLTVLALAALAAPSLLAVRLAREGLLGSRPWVLLVAGAGLYGVASPFWGVLPVVTGRTLPFPSVVDAVYFVSYALSGAFLVSLLIRQHRHGIRGRRGAAIALLDAGVVAVAVIAALWPSTIGPNLADPYVAGLSLLVSAGYPLVSAMLVGLVVRVALGSTWTPQLWLLLVWAGGAYRRHRLRLPHRHRPVHLQPPHLGGMADVLHRPGSAGAAPWPATPDRRGQPRDPAAVAGVAATRIQHELAEPLVICNESQTVAASIGIVEADERQHHPNELLRQADTAMYAAKAAGGGRHMTYEPGMDGYDYVSLS